ncbi:MAG: GAF domain-containing protein [Stigonema ocellatum SAG 48.90 = DSM 106950]|nr:GAF domain-containing protein [Stigonema ocellatum SAG 48.90 = DSM 106950]
MRRNLVNLTRATTELQQAEESLQQQRARERLVTDIAHRIRQSLNLEEILNTTVSEVRQFLQTERVFIYRFQPDWGGVVVVESVGDGWQSLVGSSLKDPDFAQSCIDAYKKGRLQATNDIYTSSLPQCYIDFLEQFQVRATLVVPILQGEQLWGLLVANHCSSPRQWQQLEIDLLKQLATQLAIALQQSQLYKQTQYQLHTEQALNRVIQTIRNSLDLKTIFSTAVFEIAQLLQADRSHIVQYLPQRQIWLNVADYCRSPDIPGALGLEIPDEGNEIAAKLKRLEVVQIDDASTCQDEINRGFAQTFPGSWLLIPLHFGSAVWGSLGLVRNSQPALWQLEEVELTCAVADQMAIAIQQSTLLEQIQIELNERKQAEQKISEQAALLDVAKDAILVQDMENRIVFWNQGAERLYGWMAHETLGKETNHLLFQGASPQLQDIYKVVAQKSEWQGELTQVQKDGQKIIVESRWTLVRDLNGQPKSILVVNTDITEKKQLEAQFLRTQRLESLGTLASGMAHELNNMLAPILMSVQLLKMKLPDEQSLGLLQRLETSVKRSAALVKQVLSFARGVEGDRTILQVKHLLLELEQIAKQTFPKSIQIRTDIPSNLCAVSGDATQMQQVLINLAVNARDVMPDGGILRVCAKNFFIDENYARINLEASVGAYIVITVSDTGMGIPPEILDRIFDPFFTTKEVGKGTGLGLSTVMGTIKSHGGFVKVASEVGKGSQFQVYLPAVSEAFSQPEEDQEMHTGQGESILVVDEEASVLEITQIVLLRHNYKVLTASDGMEAIALYIQHQNEISLVLTDIMMASMDGSTLLRALQKINPHVKVIAMSGLGSNTKIADGIAVKAFLSKPYTTKELLKTINEVKSN